MVQGKLRSNKSATGGSFIEVEVGALAILENLPKVVTQDDRSNIKDELTNTAIADESATDTQVTDANASAKPSSQVSPDSNQTQQNQSTNHSSVEQSISTVAFVPEIPNALAKDSSFSASSFTPDNLSSLGTNLYAFDNGFNNLGSYTQESITAYGSNDSSLSKADTATVQDSFIGDRN